MHLPDTIEHLATAALVPYARNSRTHSIEQIGKVADSIRRFGFTNPVLVRGDTIIAGHGRVMAAKALDMATVPVIRLDHLTEDEARAYVIADNKLAELAGWDDDLLALEVRHLNDAGFELDLLGFGDDEIKELLFVAPVGNTNADAAPDLDEIAVTRHGDIWVLGGHRLLCGDSTSTSAMAQLMAGKQADACWTDPPYNVAYGGDDGNAANKNKVDGGVRNTREILNDDMSDEDFHKFLGGFYRAAHGVMKKGAAIYVAHAETKRTNFTRQFLDAGFKLSGVIIWRKDTLVLGRSDYQWIHEPILYGWKEGGGAQVFRRSQADHRQRHRQQRIAVRAACRWQVADHHRRGSAGRRWRGARRMGRGFDHA